jgi:diacylglycerol kinase family enzyme
MRSVAALVNVHAHRVTPAHLATLRRELGEARVVVTRSAAEASAAMARLVDDRVEVICVLGGDGTFTQAAGDLYELARDRPPLLFALRGGLGNAISDISGSSSATPRGLRADLARARGDEPPAPLRLLRANGRIACYAGVGLDAQFVEDLYAVAKEGRRHRGRGLTGLAATVLLRSLPRLVRYQPPRVTITARGPATGLDREGRPSGASARAGDVIFEGTALVAAGGTIASYGRGFQAFPFADAVGGERFSLRVWTIGAAELIWHLPAIWRGTYAPRAGVLDWAATAVTMEWSTPRPIHIGGDLVPRTSRLELELLPRTLPILRKSL